MDKIVNAGWSIGNFCNARCKHCYSWKQRKDNSNVLTDEEVNIILDKLIRYGVHTVNFGGNEPIFTNGSDPRMSKLPYIIDKLSEAGIICGITTNGYTAKFLHDNFFETFMKVNDWDFSLDHPCKELHDSNRGVSGLFDMVIDAIALCHKYKKPCSIVIAGMKTNLDEDSLQKYIQLAQNTGTDLRINVLKPIEQAHFKLMPSYEQVYNAFRYLLENTEMVTFSESVFASQLGLDCFGCPCGINSFRIQSKRNGIVPVTPCVYLDINGGDILTTEIEDIIKSEGFKKIICRNTKLPKKCKEIKCEYLEKCRGGCSAATLLNTGDLDELNPFCPYHNEVVSKRFKETIVSKAEGDEQIRVHENYLCTWIGKMKSGNES